MTLSITTADTTGSIEIFRKKIKMSIFTTFLMPNVTMMSVVILTGFLLRVISLKAVKLSVILMTVFTFYIECRNADSCYNVLQCVITINAVVQRAIILNVVTLNVNIQSIIMPNVAMIWMLYSENKCAEWHYAKYRYDMIVIFWESVCCVIMINISKEVGIRLTGFVYSIIVLGVLFLQVNL